MDKKQEKILTALEFNSATIRVCRSVARAGTRDVTHCFSFSARESEPETPQKIRQQFKKHGLKSGHVILMLPRYIAISRLLRLPSTQGEELKEMVRLRVLRESLGIKPEEIVYDWRVVGQDKEGYTLVSVFVAQKERIKNYLAVLAKAGMSAELVTLNTAGFLRAAQQGVQCVSLLNADHETFDFNVLLAGHPVFSRTFAAPDYQDPLCFAQLSKELKVSFELARRLSGALFEPDGKLYITGVLDGLNRQDLEGLLQRPVEFFSSHQGSVQDAPVSYAAVAGFVLNGRQGAIDLTPDETRQEMRRRRKIVGAKKAVYLALGIFWVFSVIFILFLDKKIDTLNGLYRTMRADAALEIEARPFQLSASFEKDVLTDKLYLDAFKALYEIVPTNIFLSEFKISEGAKASWSGESPDAKALFEFLGLLRRSAYFKDARLEFMENGAKDSNKSVRFEMECDLSS